MKSSCSILPIVVFAGLACVSSTALAETVVVTYVLDDVWLLPDITHPHESAQRMTGSFEWTYEVNDFENGTGEFIDLSTPWYDPGIDELNITIELSSIEFSLVGNYHDLGLDLTLVLQEPLPPDQPALIDTANSLFEIQQGIGRRGHVISGSIVPILARCLADMDIDGQVDLADHAILVGCAEGPGQPLAPGCEAADLDGDNDADMADFAILQTEFDCS